MSSSAAMGGDAIPAAMEEAARLKYGSDGMLQSMFLQAAFHVVESNALNRALSLHAMSVA